MMVVLDEWLVKAVEPQRAQRDSLNEITSSEKISNSLVFVVPVVFVVVN